MKPLFWVGSAKKDLLELPVQVVDVVGYALYLAQSGHKHQQAKPLKGLHLSRGVYRQVQQQHICAALFPEKIAQGHRDVSPG